MMKMSTYQSGKYHGESGLAIIMVVFVALFLLAISLAYIVCSKNSLNQSHLSQGKIKGVIVAEAGMERALWCLQNRADNGQEITEESISGNYDELLKGYKDKSKAREYGVIIPEMGTNTRYAARTVEESDGDTNNGKEMAIYVIGVTRQANPMGEEVSNIKAMKMLVRIGTREAGMPKIVFGGGGRISQRTNSMWQVKGNIYAADGFVQNAKSTISSYNGFTNAQLSSSKYDKWLAGTDVVLEGPWADTITAIDEPNRKLKRGSTEKQELPVFNVADFASPKDDYRGPDYTLADLISKGWTLDAKNNVLISPEKQVMSIWNKPPGTVDNNGNLQLDKNEPWVANWLKNFSSFPESEVADGIYYDRNEDGYTSIYMGQGSPNLRIMPYRGYTASLQVRPGARGIIASQGKGNNFYKNGGDGYLTWGGQKIGADMKSNNNVSIEVRGRIAGEAKSGSADKEVYKEQNDVPYVGFHYKGTIYDASNPPEPMGENWGALSIIGENDVIISETGDIRMAAQSSRWDVHSDFRGFVYSKNNLKIQTDILFQGMMIGVVNADVVDHGSAGWGLSSYGDGWDPSLYYEDPLEPSGNGRSFFPKNFAPSGNAIIRDMVVLSWEADKFYKKKI
ncbi:MAG: hypothetical protein QME49_02730 [bacterium]|nr:hypothetical protein [bacterium]